ncbi:hypothetical protein [Methanobacterium congolense]|uniref:Region of a membrane-bound protein predicted to be embedded in the membrane n=1 Tax=Methanobacterium congolense TaxID=118062 RepID=A0A1D3L295_9EURY|nr:hypothetical protein [Methanobacterium congolense]SCG85784.1 Region of a membrane-bound protein predicted to be embedded in the membrane [Methanobacterium congolense]
MSEEYRALTVTEKVLKILKNCFESEGRGGSSARSRAESGIKPFLLETEDGSPSDRIVRMDSLKPCTQNTVPLKRPYKNLLNLLNFLRREMLMFLIYAVVWVTISSMLGTFKTTSHNQDNSKRRIHIDMVEISKKPLGLLF